MMMTGLHKDILITTTKWQ